MIKEEEMLNKDEMFDSPPEENEGVKLNLEENIESKQKEVEVLQPDELIEKMENCSNEIQSKQINEENEKNNEINHQTKEHIAEESLVDEKIKISLDDTNHEEDRMINSNINLNDDLNLREHSGKIKENSESNVTCKEKDSKDSDIVLDHNEVEHDEELVAENHCDNIIKTIMVDSNDTKKDLANKEINEQENTKDIQSLQKKEFEVLNENENHLSAIAEENSPKIHTKNEDDVFQFTEEKEILNHEINKGSKHLEFAENKVIQSLNQKEEVFEFSDVKVTATNANLNKEEKVFEFAEYSDNQNKEEEVFEFAKNKGNENTNKEDGVVVEDLFNENTNTEDKVIQFADDKLTENKNKENDVFEFTKYKCSENINNVDNAFEFTENKGTENTSKEKGAEAKGTGNVNNQVEVFEFAEDKDENTNKDKEVFSEYKSKDLKKVDEVFEFAEDKGTGNVNNQEEVSEFAEDKLKENTINDEEVFEFAEDKVKENTIKQEEVFEFAEDKLKENTINDEEVFEFAEDKVKENTINDEEVFEFAEDKVKENTIKEEEVFEFNEEGNQQEPVENIIKLETAEKIANNLNLFQKEQINEEQNELSPEENRNNSKEEKLIEKENNLNANEIVVNKIEAHINSEKDEFEFNEVEEENPKALIVKEAITLEVNNNDDDEFNFVEDEEPVNQLASQQENKEIKEKLEIPEPIEVKQVEFKEDDDEGFDFVEEEENVTTKINEEIKPETMPERKVSNANDDFDFVEESEEAEVVKTETNHSEINKQQKVKKPIINYVEGRNKERISNLLLEYKEKHLNKKTAQIELNKKSTPSKENISSFFLDIEVNNNSLKKLIENIPNFKSEPEIGLKSLNINEIISLSKNENHRQKEKKETKFKSTVAEFSNNSIKKLYFKYIDLKNIYVNVTQLSSNKTGLELLSPMMKRKTSNSELNQKEKDDFGGIVLTENNITDNYTPKPNKDDVFNFEDGDKAKSKPKASIQSVNQPSDFEFTEDINEDFEEDKNTKPKIEINKALYSIMIDPSLIPTSPVIKKEEIVKEDTSQDKKEEEIQSVYDETKMLEFLKTMTKSKESNTNLNVKSEEEKNNEELSQIIQSLPNYNFMISKFVEYPDSLFTI